MADVEAGPSGPMDPPSAPARKPKFVPRRRPNGPSSRRSASTTPGASVPPPSMQDKAAFRASMTPLNEQNGENDEERGNAELDTVHEQPESAPDSPAPLPSGSFALSDPSARKTGPAVTKEQPQRGRESSTASATPAPSEPDSPPTASSTGGPFMRNMASTFEAPTSNIRGGRSETPDDPAQQPPILSGQRGYPVRRARPPQTLVRPQSPVKSATHPVQIGSSLFNDDLSSDDDDSVADASHQPEKAIESESDIERPAISKGKGKGKATAASKAKGKGKATTSAKKAKGKGKQKAVAAEGEQDDEEEEPSQPPAAQPSKRGRKKKAPAADGETAAAPPKKKRGRPRKNPAPATDSHIDEAMLPPLPSSSSNQVARNTREGSAGTDARSDDEEGFEPNRPAKKQRRSYIEKIAIEPGKTKMADLATTRDVFDGRKSSKTDVIKDRFDQQRRLQAIEREVVAAKAEHEKYGREFTEQMEQEMRESLVNGLKKVNASTASPLPSRPLREGSAASSVARRTPVPVAGPSGSRLAITAAADSDEDLPEASALSGMSQADIARFTQQYRRGSDDDGGDGEGEDGMALVLRQNGDNDDDDEEDGQGAADGDEHVFQPLDRVPQIRFTGEEITLDQSTLQVEMPSGMGALHTGPDVEEDHRFRFVNSVSHSKKPRSSKWTEEETDRFYSYIAQYGTDFEMLAKLFPGRDRRQIKAKWNREDKVNPARITEAFKKRKKIDLDDWTTQTGRKIDVDGPVPEDPMDKINEMRAQAEAAGITYGRPEKRRGKGKKRAEDEENANPTGEGDGDGDGEGDGRRGGMLQIEAGAGGDDDDEDGGQGRRAASTSDEEDDFDEDEIERQKQLERALADDD